MLLKPDMIDLRVFPSEAGFHILAFSEEGEEIGGAILETGPSSRFRSGHGYFIDSGILDGNGRAAVVTSLDVRKPWAGQGIGRAILERAVALAEEHDCDAIYVHASDIGRGDPAGFYLACAFEIVSSDSSYLPRITEWDSPKARTEPRAPAGVHACAGARGSVRALTRLDGFPKLRCSAVYLRKRISEADRAARAFETSLGLLNQIVFGSAHRWLRLCSSWIEEANGMNRRIFDTLLGDG